MLAAELQDTRVRVHVLCPAVVRTQFHGIDGKPVLGPNVPVTEPLDVVEALLAGMRAGERICIRALEDGDRLSAINKASRALFNAGRGAERNGERLTNRTLSSLWNRRQMAYCDNKFCRTWEGGRGAHKQVCETWCMPSPRSVEASQGSKDLGMNSW